MDRSVRKRLVCFIVFAAFTSRATSARKCVDFLFSKIQNGKSGLKIQVPHFRETLSGSRSMAERFDLNGKYTFSCSGNSLTLLNVKKKVKTKCPEIRIKSHQNEQQHVYGYIELPSVGYTFKRCIYSVLTENGVKYQKIGSLWGKSKKAEIAFNITTSGSRHSCALSKPTFGRNLVFFSEGFFVTEMEMDGMNNRLIRENIMNVINGKLGSSLASYLSPTNACSTFLKVKWTNK